MDRLVGPKVDRRVDRLEGPKVVQMEDRRAGRMEVCWGVQKVVNPRQRRGVAVAFRPLLEGMVATKGALGRLRVAPPLRPAPPVH